ncbi:hypothetical protein PG988_005646 [Apiospora saccharicola]
MDSNHVVDLAGGRSVVLLVVASLLLLFYGIFVSKPSLSKDIATLNARKGELFPYLKAAWRNTLDLKSALELHRFQHAGQTVRVPIVGPGKLILIPTQEAKWLIDQPEDVLSMHQQTDLHFQTAYKTVYPLRNQAHVHLVTTKLTRQVGNLVSTLMDEIEIAMPQAWDLSRSSGDDEWQAVDVFDTLRVVIGQVTNRVFVGAPLCRNRELLDAGVAYAQAIPVAAQVISLFPSSLRFLVAPFITMPNRAYEKKWFKLVVPEIESRLRDYGEKGQEKADFLQWSIQQAKETGDAYMWEPKILAARVLLVNAAAVHTSAFAITHVLLDLVGCGAHRGAAYVAELREEIREVLAAHGGWSKRALDDMHKLDSTFRESQRLNTVLTVGPLRIVNAREGVTTPSGVQIPKGYQVGIPAYQVHMDPSIWGEDVEEFRPFRFLANTRNPNEEETNDASQPDRPRQPWITTSQEYLSFGGGRNSCPGRFFAAAELKLLLAHILLNYDFEFQEQRLPNQWFGTNHLPPKKATIRVKRRDV